MKMLRNRKLLPVLILAAAALVAAFIIITSPETEKREPARAVPTVGTMPLKQGEYDIKVEAFGNVLPSQQVTITPEVTGRIVSMNPEMEPGGLMREGDMLLSIDDSDYKLAVERAEAGLREARAELELEKGRQIVAKREWEVFGNTMDAEVSGELALRKPQLAQAEADVKSAEANLGEAKLNLSRTTIRAPFDSIVLEESVDIGQRVGPTTSVATIAGTGEFWVSASVPLDSFNRIIPEDNGHGSPVSVYLDNGLGGTVLRCGKVIRKLGNLDPEGRMGKVLISIEDPLSLKEAAHEKSVPLDSYVRAEISTGTIAGVYRIPRRGLRENNTIWVVDNGNKLRIRPVTIAWRYQDDVYVHADFGEGDRLIDSHLSSVIPGMDVTIRKTEEETEPAGEKIASAGAEPFCGKE